MLLNVLTILHYLSLATAFAALLLLAHHYWKNHVTGERSTTAPD